MAPSVSTVGKLLLDSLASTGLLRGTSETTSLENGEQPLPCSYSVAAAKDQNLKPSNCSLQEEDSSVRVTSASHARWPNDIPPQSFFCPTCHACALVWCARCAGVRCKLCDNLRQLCCATLSLRCPAESHYCVRHAECANAGGLLAKETAGECVERHACSVLVMSIYL